jgi:D-alanine-D-alanine ligase
MINLLILFGGQSSEHVVSCSSTASLLPYIKPEEIHVVTVGITKKGEWLLTQAAPEEIADGSWERRQDNLTAFLSPNRAMKGLQVIRDGRIESIPVDCIFPVMHGELCEDGAIQGLFELTGIPYVGPDICASACCMDKAVTKLVASISGVRQARYFLVSQLDFDNAPVDTVLRVEQAFGGVYPLFVKPASAGSSVGVSKAHDSKELRAALRQAIRVCSKVLVEETIVGREVEVAVLGNHKPQASVVGEVLAANEFYDFNAKYENNASRTEIPARISETAARTLREDAVRIYQALGCSGLSRVDFFLTADDEVIFNEINTLPGFTKISMYPMLWQATGIPYGELLTRLCQLAMEHGCRVPREQ